MKSKFRGEIFNLSEKKIKNRIATNFSVEQFSKNQNNKYK